MRRQSLRRLIDRSIGRAAVLQPVLPSRFEPVGRVSPFEPGPRSNEERLEAEPPARGPAVRPAPPAPVRPAAARIPEEPGFDRGEAPRRSARVKAEPGVSRPARARSSRQPEAAAEAQREVSSRPPAPPDIGEPRRDEAVLMASSSDERRVLPAEVHAVRTERPPLRDEPDRRDEGPWNDAVEAPSEHGVTVHIGRIEVRAVVAGAKESGERPRPAGPQRLTLSEYLRQREKRAT